MKNGIEEHLSCIKKEMEKLERSYRESEVILKRLDFGYDILKDKDKSSKSENAGAHHDDVKIEYIPETNIYYSRKMMQAYHNEEVSIERWAEINEEVAKCGLKVCGPVTVTYYTELLDQFLSKTCDIEFGIQVEESKCEQVRRFGGFEAATIFHVGAYSDIIKTYVKALQWVNQSEYKVNGPVSEEFIISPTDVNRECEHVTKILIPVLH